MNKKIVIAENPNAGARDKQSLLSDLKAGLIARGYLVEQESDRKKIQDLLDIDGSTNEERIACVICAGGDGTIGFVANCSAPATPLAILPLGTENVLAKQLGFDCDISRLMDKVDSSKTFALDAGEANGQLFLAVA